MEIKKINLSLYKTLKLAIDLKIDLQLTPGQCKELIDFIDNPLVVDECCEYKADPPNEFGYVHSKTSCGYTYTDVCHEFVFCPNCGRKIKYVEVE